MKSVVLSWIIIKQWGLAQEKKGKGEEGEGCVEILGLGAVVPFFFCYKEKAYQLGMIKESKAQVQPLWRVSRGKATRIQGSNTVYKALIKHRWRVDLILDAFVRSGPLKLEQILLEG